MKEVYIRTFGWPVYSKSMMSLAAALIEQESASEC